MGGIEVVGCGCGVFVVIVVVGVVVIAVTVAGANDVVAAPAINPHLRSEGFSYKWIKIFKN